MGKKLRKEAKKVAKWLTKSKNGAKTGQMVFRGKKRGKSPKKGHLPRFGGIMVTLIIIINKNDF